MIKTQDKQSSQVRITATVCPACGAVLYPTPLVCRCGHVLSDSDALRQRVDVRGPCKLLTWTRVKAVPEGFDDSELTLGMVEFDSGVRAIGILHSDQPRVGMDLEAEVEECDAGDYRHGACYTFKEIVCANS